MTSRYRIRMRQQRNYKLVAVFLILALGLALL